MINRAYAKDYHVENYNTALILILACHDHFGLYTEEILKAEGFNEFQTHSLNESKLALDYLKQFDVIILTETSITQSQKEMFARFVKEGGHLIAFWPDKKMSDVFGITDARGTVTDGYISINTKHEIGTGMISESLQFHGKQTDTILKAANRYLHYIRMRLRRQPILQW